MKQQEVRCKLCGRRLKDELSIKRKMGKTCYKKYLKELKEKRKKLL